MQGAKSGCARSEGHGRRPSRRRADAASQEADAADHCRRCSARRSDWLRTEDRFGGGYLAFYWSAAPEVLRVHVLDEVAEVLEQLVLVVLGDRALGVVLL